MLPDVFFGEVKESNDDWRDEDQDIGPDDDEELAETPRDVVALLGFDPLEGA
jgi:hypothetical protein